MRIIDTNYCTATATTVTASSAASNFPSSNLKNEIRSKRWRSTGITSENIVYDFGSAVAIDSVVLLWPKETDIKLSNTAVITIQANSSNAWGSPAVSQALTVDTTYKMASHYFSSDQTYRYWRVLIVDTSNTYGYVELGLAFIGKALTLNPPENGMEFSLTDKSKKVSTEYGVEYIDVLPTIAQLSFDFRYLTYSDSQTLENSFRRNGIQKPVFVTVDQNSSLFNKNHFAIYGRYYNQFSNKHVVYNLFDQKIRITETA